MVTKGRRLAQCFGIWYSVKFANVNKSLTFGASLHFTKTAKLVFTLLRVLWGILIGLEFITVQKFQSVKTTKIILAAFQSVIIRWVSTTARNFISILMIITTTQICFVAAVESAKNAVMNARKKI